MDEAAHGRVLCPPPKEMESLSSPFIIAALSFGNSALISWRFLSRAETATRYHIAYLDSSLKDASHTASVLRKKVMISAFNEVIPHLHF